jgi:peptide/nickel transport system substrate-binding protein
VAELPRGTVTFLFTDIEGSTRLLKQLGERYAEVIAEQGRMLREAADERSGRLVDTQGDSCFFAFARANAALGAAVAAQRALAGHAWPEGCEVRVRMGLHTGEPAVGDERYVGLGVHRAARIGAVAHGGQVLLSEATRALVEDEVGGVSVRDLGSYRLKDIDRPERLYQLDIDGLRTEFPPLNAERVGESRPLRRRAVLLSALAGVIAAAVAIPIFALGQGGGGAALRSAAPNSVGFVDAKSNRLVAEVPVTAPTALTTGAGAVWVVNTTSDSVDRVDPTSHTIRQTIPVGNGPSGIAYGDGSIWVANGLSGTVSRISPQTNRRVDTIAVGNGPGGIVYAAGSIWVANTGDGTITKIDPATDKASKPLDVAATELAYGGGALWASVRAANQVVRIDPSTGEAQPVPVGNGPAGIAFGAGGVWVANSLDGTVSRIDPESNSIAAVIPAVGNGPAAVSVDSNAVWVSSQYDGTLVRIDPRTNQVAQRIFVGNRPQGVAILGGTVLVGVGQSTVGHRGGTLTWTNSGFVDSIDPAVAYDAASWPILRMTGDGLVAFDQASGLDGAQLVPDLAVALPTATDGGRTYAFRLRPGIRYSNGRPLNASDVRSTFERDFAVGKLPVDYYDGIVGASGCKGKRAPCDLSHGIVVNDAARTVTFHLVSPDPEFLYKLALPFAYVVPAGTPARDTGTRPLPAIGPYVITSYRPNHSVTLARNRHFREWSRAAQPDGYPDRLVYRMGATPDQGVKDVIRGRADAFESIVGVPSPDLLDEVRTRFAGQLHSNTYLRQFALFLNTRLAPFDRLDVRRALNYAADRAAAVEAVGGPDVAQASCQILPPHFPGYRPYCPYSAGTTREGGWKAPDVVRARELVAASGTRGMKVTVWAPSPLRALGAYGVRLLTSLGYRAALKVLDPAKYFSTAFDSRNRVQVGILAWTSDYPVASGFFEPILTCASFRPGSAGNLNAAAFCDPRIDRQVARARVLQATDPQAAGTLWEGIDRQTVDEAPWVPLVTPKTLDVVAKRVGNYQYSPMWAMLIDQLWVR